MFRKLSLVFLTCIGSSGLAHASTWDLAKDFSLTENPNGAWSYGYKSAANGPFKLFASTYSMTLAGYSGDRGASVYWGAQKQSDGVYLPQMALFIGQEGFDVTLLAGGAQKMKQKAGGVVCHPADGVSCVTRWTAPVAGTYHIQATFTNADYVSGSTTRVTVNKNAESLFSAGMSGLAGLKHFATPDAGIALNKGDLIEFVVDPSGNYSFDSTGMDATIKNINVRR